MHPTLKKLGKWTIRCTILGVLAVNWSILSQANAATPLYTGYKNYKGNCADGYYSVVTEPTDVPANLPANQVKEYALPKNVCVYRVTDNYIPYMEENFSTKDFIKISPQDGRILPYKPYASGELEDWLDYEPILGHYNSNHTYINSIDPRHPRHNDFSGAHSVLVYKSAKASVKLVNGLYYFDKQIQLQSSFVSAICPNGYSTVGDSSICYSQQNELKLNSSNKVELIALETFTKYHTIQDCPLGLTKSNNFGSNGGICTSTKVVFSGIKQMADFGITIENKAGCPQGEYNRGSPACIPGLAIVYCQMNNSSVGIFKKYSHTTGLHATFIDTERANTGTEVLTPFDTYYNNMTFGKIDVMNIKTANELFANDGTMIQQSSAITSGSVPVVYLHTMLPCESVWKNASGGGYNLEPFPSAW